MEALRASSALPLVSEIVEYKGKHYMDGGLSWWSSHWFYGEFGLWQTHCRSDTSKGYRKEPSKTSKRIYKLFYRKYPEFVQVASNRHIHYNKSIEKIEALEKTGNLYAIRPEHAWSWSIGEGSWKVWGHLSRGIGTNAKWDVSSQNISWRQLKTCSGWAHSFSWFIERRHSLTFWRRFSHWYKSSRQHKAVIEEAEQGKMFDKVLLIGCLFLFWPPEKEEEASFSCLDSTCFNLRWHCF